MRKLLIYCDEKELERSCRLTGAAEKINNGENTLFAVSTATVTGAFSKAFDFWFRLSDKSIKPYDPVHIAVCISELHKMHEFDCIFIPSTQFGRVLAPRLAMMLKSGLVADVTEINQDNENIEFIRPAFDGKLMAAVVHTADKPLMATINPDVFSTTALKMQKNTQVIDFVPTKLPQTSLKLLSRKPLKQQSDIRVQKILISGGGGVLDGFNRLQALADSLGAMVSASRRAVDSGVAGREIQVGQSGKIVSPSLYMAFGIYGAMQHVEGLKNVTHMICVNSNRYAPLCSLADIVVEGDAAEFARLLTEKIKSEVNNDI